jgi:hypothetical protein
VRNVIRATGWTGEHAFAPASTHPERPETILESQQNTLANWAGLGADGILAEACDPSGTCNQDGQTFKGIFFHHLTTFCAPLPSVPVRPGRTYAASRETKILHARSCKEYAKWVVHNAKAALRTRNKEGRFGSWWGADVHAEGIKVKREANATDYRNNPDEYASQLEEMVFTSDDPEANTKDDEERLAGHDVDGDQNDVANASGNRDLNDRGRGRTVETQGSGVAVVRAMLEFVKLAEGDGSTDP